METCQKCKQEKPVVGAVVAGTYYPAICKSCIASLQPHSGLSSGHTSYEGRRQFEDYADETVQPYNASGPNAEFYRLYPTQAEKIFTKEEIEEVKRKI